MTLNGSSDLASKLLGMPVIAGIFAMRVGRDTWRRVDDREPRERAGLTPSDERRRKP